MTYVIGIDTGGTYTDSVLLDPLKKNIIAKAKAFTTKEDLSVGIANSLSALGELPSDIDKVVLSTTLATNAVVENNLHPVGALFIGKTPKGEIPAACAATVQGKINVKGREEIRIDEEEIEKEVRAMLHKCEAIAVTGYMSIRNPIQEQKVKALIRKISSVPVVCGHELSSGLGFSERAATAVLNAALLPVIADFLDAIEKVLQEKAIEAPIFMVRGDGTMANLNTIRSHPAETILSGPATSIIGAMYLTNQTNALISDMGGTTTDTAILKNGEVKLSPIGAAIGPWRTQIPSAELYTCGIGGDSKISFQSHRSCTIGPKRTLPICRGGKELTPTDLLHYFGDFSPWDRESATTAVEKVAAEQGLSPRDCAEQIKENIVNTITKTCLLQNKDLPIIAIGAPVRYWFEAAAQQYGFSLIIPKHHEVANAVGAAAAELKEIVTVLIRPGEDGHGYLIHTPTARYATATKEEAITKGLEAAANEAEERIRHQGAVHLTVHTDHQDIFCEETEYSRKQYIETRIRAIAIGNFI